MNATEINDQVIQDLNHIADGQSLHHAKVNRLVRLGLVEDGKLNKAGWEILKHVNRSNNEDNRDDAIAARVAAKKSAPTNKKAADLNRCACSDDCDATSRNVFAPGHDARWAGIAGRQIAAEADDTYTSLVVRERVEQIAPVGTSEALIAKAARVARNAIDKARAKRAKQAAKAA